MEITFEQKKCITPKFRASYLNITKPKGFQGQEPKYSVTMLFDKTTDLAKLKAAAMAAGQEKWGPKFGEMLKQRKPDGAKAVKWPFRDGAEKPDNDDYKGKIFVMASSKAENKPGLVDNTREEILDDSAVYSGCFMRASVVAFAYDTQGNKGVSFSLLNLQKMGDGKRMGGKRAAKDEFDAVEDASEDAENYEAETEEDDTGF